VSSLVRDWLTQSFSRLLWSSTLVPFRSHLTYIKAWLNCPQCRQLSVLVHAGLDDNHPASLLSLVMNQGFSPILNPVVYLNYLSHGVDYEITRDVSLATLGVRCAAVIPVSYPSDVHRERP